MCSMHLLVIIIGYPSQALASNFTRREIFMNKTWDLCIAKKKFL
jgi:hypothetical protein